MRRVTKKSNDCIVTEKVEKVTVFTFHILIVTMKEHTLAGLTITLVYAYLCHYRFKGLHEIIQADYGLFTLVDVNPCWFLTHNYVQGKVNNINFTTHDMMFI